MEKFFKIKERGSTVNTEIIAGITTFFAMAYIIFVEPDYLSQAGMDFTAVMVATCIASAVGCILTAFLGNVPFAQAPGMGLNAFFTYTVCFSMGFTWQQGLTIVLLSGILFLIISVTPLRKKVIASLPPCLKSAISAGIGLFIAFIGLLNANVVKLFGDTVVDDVVVGTDYADMGAITSSGPLLTIIGIVIIAILLAWKVKGALIIGILVTTLIGIPMGVTQIPENIAMSNIGNFGQAFGAAFAGFDGLFSVEGGFAAVFTAVISFFIVDMFDTVGTLIGTASSAGILDKNGDLQGGDKAIIADAIATCTGAICGVTTVTTYVESSTGIAAGGRTGLSSIVTGVLFLLCVLLAPVAGIVPSEATAPALVIVGVYMMKGAASIAWDDMEEAIPSFLTIAMMPFAYSISDGIGFGVISYTLIKVCRGKFKEVPVLLYALSVLFIILYVIS